MCDDPAASNPFAWNLHRATLKNLVSSTHECSSMSSNGSSKCCSTCCSAKGCSRHQVPHDVVHISLCA